MTSLEIVNELIKNIEDTMKEIKSGPWYDLRLLDLNKFNKIKQDLQRYEILKDKFDVYPIEDDECNIYYCMDLNSRDGFFVITEEQYKLLSEVGDNL